MLRPYQKQYREIRALHFSKSAWVLLRPAELWTKKSCETGPTVYRPLTEKTGAFNHLQMYVQRKHFILSYLKTLSVGPDRVRAHDLQPGCATLNQFFRQKGKNERCNLRNIHGSTTLHCPVLHRAVLHRLAATEVPYLPVSFSFPRKKPAIWTASLVIFPWCFRFFFKNCNKKSPCILLMWIYSHTVTKIKTNLSVKLKPRTLKDIIFEPKQ